MERYPKCEECEKELKDWSGNIMVPESEYPDNIPYFHVWCKECTGKLDKQGRGKTFHNIWELGWIKRDYLKMVEELFEDIKIGEKQMVI